MMGLIYIKRPTSTIFPEKPKELKEFQKNVEDLEKTDNEILQIYWTAALWHMDSHQASGHVQWLPAAHASRILHELKFSVQHPKKTLAQADTTHQSR